MADAADRESRGWVGWAQVGLLVVALAVGIYFARSPGVAPIGGDAIRSAEAPSVRVLRPDVGSHSLTVTLTGEVHARTPVALRPLASGRVVQVSPALRAGGTFKAGETLFVVDPEDTELRLERAQGMLAAARGRLRRHQGPRGSGRRTVSRPKPGRGGSAGGWSLGPDRTLRGPCAGGHCGRQAGRAAVVRNTFLAALRRHRDRRTGVGRRGRLTGNECRYGVPDRSPGDARAHSGG